MKLTYKVWEGMVDQGGVLRRVISAPRRCVHSGMRASAELPAAFAIVAVASS